MSQDSTPLFVFAGGGSGGHLVPGIAVAEELRRRIPACRIRFSTSGRPIEDALLGPCGFERTMHTALPLSAVRRHPLKFVWSHWRSLQHERLAVRTDRPAAVVGLGGYASVPLILAAQRERVPTLLLEQNAVPGRASRWLARQHPVCLTFEQSRQKLPRQAVAHLTGNPLRGPMLALAESNWMEKPEPRTLLVLGGSQGSRQVNLSVLDALPSVPVECLKQWRVIHQTGPHDETEVRRRYQTLGIDATVSAFISDMPACYGVASLAVSRAGATTLSELALAGVPAILIPYPAAADDHQRLNARPFVDNDAAVSLETRSTGDTVPLANDLGRLMLSPNRLAAMSAAMREHARPDATAAVADLVLLMSGLG